MWERACSRMRCDSQYLCRLTHRIREQACSHIGSWQSCNQTCGILTHRFTIGAPDQEYPCADSSRFPRSRQYGRRH
ncbi:hypothetical protein E3W21_00740 [Pseudomonas sp. F01002]|nr:hypothetical protein E3W21_00740 [Pseudomonas sp. F01002]